MESRSDIAREKKMSGQYNCAQAVACTYSDIVGADEAVVRDVTAAFGTGMGNMEGTCGALVGAGVILGMAIKDRVAARAVMKRVMSDFASVTGGATTCRCLKGIGTGTPVLDCNDCVSLAATLLERNMPH